jgi:histone-lysine N-methyltransferase SETMAR
MSFIDVREILILPFQRRPPPFISKPLFEYTAEKMELPESEIRPYVKIRTLLGNKSIAIHQELVEVCGEHAPHYNTVQTWAKRFREGRSSIEDDPRPGRPLSATTPSMIAAVKAVVDDDPHCSIEDISVEVGISFGSVQSILHEDLGLRKLCSRWIPHLLSTAQKQQRLETASFLVGKMKYWSQKQWDSIATGDETWLRFFEPRRKEQNKVWIASEDPRPTICKVTPSSGKALYTIFLTRQGTLLQKPVPPHRTITGTYYRDEILADLLSDFQKTNPTQRMWLHHDNAPAHTSAIVLEFLQENNVRIIPHPPYSPDLAICDFWIFPRLKDHLRGAKFESRSAIGSAVYQYFKQCPKTFFVDAFAEWRRRLDLCIAANGDYFEQVMK